MLSLLALFLSLTINYIAGNCIDGCQQPTLLYNSLNCTPVFASPHDCCPSQFDCSHIEKRASSQNEKCYFHGKSYKIGEMIDDDEVYGSCRAGCICNKKNSGRMGFDCAVFDCPARVSKPNCQLKYELDKCCSTGEVCPPFSTSCEVNGKVHYEGERFDAPTSKCTRCICQGGFTGKFEAPFCKKQDCMDEISFQSRVMNFCAPSYVSLNDCCPFNWICPDVDDIIQTSKTGSTENHGLQCKFGAHALNIGDKFERMDSSTGGKLSCECRIPPYLTCIQDYSYSTYWGEF